MAIIVKQLFMCVAQAVLLARIAQVQSGSSNNGLPGYLIYFQVTGASVEPTSSGLIDTLSNLNVGWILAIVAVLTLVRYNMLKNDGDGLQTIAEYVESGIVAVVLVWMIIRPFAVQAYFIPSPSMEPTLFGENGSGDRILVNKFIYRTGKPKHDDVVVFIPPTNAEEIGSTNDGDVPVDENGMPINFIKRLIGEPGDTLEVHAGVVWVNSQTIWVRILPTSWTYKRNTT
jgi:signal peptidase I